MDVVLGQNVTFDFTTHDPLSGAVSNADFLPTCGVFEDNTDVPILIPVVVGRAGLVGDYRVTFAASAANGFEVGKSYNVIATVTVNGIRAKARIANFVVEGVLVIPELGTHFKI